MTAEYERILERAVSRRQQITQIGKQLKKMKPKQLQALFQELHDEAFSRIDCLDCANCCAAVGPRLNEQDIERVGKALKLKRKEVIEGYLLLDEDGDYIFREHPCPFLCGDNRCLIYAERPKACREYPHTDQRYIHRYIRQTVINSRHCPAVALMFEALQKREVL